MNKYTVKPEILSDSSVVYNVVRLLDGAAVAYPATKEEANMLVTLLNAWDGHYPRRVQVTRNLTLDELTPLECKALLVHSDESNTPERRKELWEKWFIWFQSPEGREYDRQQIQKRLAENAGHIRLCQQRK